MNSVFAVNIDKITEIFETALSKLSSLDKESVLKYRQQNDRYRKFVSILLTRFFIKKLFSLSNYELSYSSYGKPYLKEYSEKNFNISHSGDWVVGAVSCKPVGIDIEYINEISCFIDIAKRFFSLVEYNFLIKQSKDKQLETFYEIWTKKESLIKADGKGLSIPLDSFSVLVGNMEELDLGNKKWKVSLCDFSDSNYKLAIASAYGCNNFLPIKYLSVEELLECI